MPTYDAPMSGVVEVRVDGNLKAAANVAEGDEIDISLSKGGDDGE